MSIETNVLQFPKKLRKPRAIILDRARTKEIEPRIDNLLVELQRVCADLGKPNPYYSGFLLETNSYTDFLSAYWGAQGINEKSASQNTIFIYLPGEFEPIISNLVLQQPGAFVQPDIDLMNQWVYFGWSCELDDSSLPCELWVEEGILHSAISDYFTIYEVRRDWMPVVMVAGESVAIGGFAVDDNIAFDAQAASMSTQSLKPQEIYSNDELVSAARHAKKIGLSPWFDAPYKLSDSNGVVAAVSIFCEAKPNIAASEDSVTIRDFDMDDDKPF